ncbi:MAG: DNA replication/repair protein RecF [Chloroflexi bacterium]|nr:DNA replication/repair protein RecF [Chloroflexota bacterium]
MRAEAAARSTGASVASIQTATPAGSRAVMVERLVLAGFRSYGSLDVTFTAGPQVVFGDNAAGKTNLLEAIALLATGHSHRTTSDPDLIAWDADFARVEARVSSVNGVPGTLEVVLGAGATRKRIRVNGVPRRASALAAAMRVVMFAPEDMLLVSGSPSLRRGTLDALLVHRWATASASLSLYGRALQQRNNLLRAVRDGISDRGELRYWDELLCAEGGRIVAWRREIIGELAGPLAEAHAQIAPGEGRLALRYVTNAAATGGETPEEALRRRLAETGEKELWNGSTLVGPHRDDIAFELDARDLAGSASRGQQRTAILALKLAELALLTALDGHPPLLLLDDVFSELDPARRAHLVRRIADLPQAFISTTTLADLDPALVAESTAWHVTRGALALAEREPR